MIEYTFKIGDVNSTPGLYLSWVVEADSPEEAVELSRRSFGEHSDPLDGLEIEPDRGNLDARCMVLKLDPQQITREDIIDVYDPSGARS